MVGRPAVLGHAPGISPTGACAGDFSDLAGKSVIGGPRFPDLYYRARHQETYTSTAKEPAMPASEARLQANRANSLKSCGPRTAQGRERSSRNSLKHGLTGS